MTHEDVYLCTFVNGQPYKGGSKMRSLFKPDNLTHENNIRYFTQKANGAAWFLLIFGVVAAVMGFGSDGILMGIIGCVLIAVAIYEFVSVKLRKVTGAELDCHSAEAAKKIQLEKNALKGLCLDVWDLDAGESIILQGYAHIGVDTVPYFRRDETDGRLRSSVYQLTYFLFMPDRLYAYSYAFSLIDNKRKEFSNSFRYSDINTAGIYHEKLKYMVGGDDKKYETTETIYLRLEITQGNTYSFAFDGDEGGAAKAKHIKELLRDPSKIVLPKAATNA